MGIVEIEENKIIISSHIIIYGNEASPLMAENMRVEIENMWNEPQAVIRLHEQYYPIIFRISAAYSPFVTQEEVMANDNPVNNYFRIEEFAHSHISFVDGLGCNTGYFKKDNLYKGSTTAAHEYGHTLGLAHPSNLDIRGKGVPGIMYPRGTLVDPAYQYDPNVTAGEKGGTLNPVFRKVRQEDIFLLNLEKALASDGIKILGDFSSVWHPNHKDIDWA